MTSFSEFTTNSEQSVDSAFLSQAHQCYTLRDYSRALEFAKTAQQQNPKSPEILVLLGAIYRQLGQDTACIDVCKTALQLHPRLVEAYVNLAQAYIMVGDLQNASSSAMVGASLDPNSIPALRALATSSVRLGNTDAAVATYLALLGREPDKADARSNLGVLLMLRHQKDAAEACFTAALASNPDYIHALRNLAALKKDQNLLHEAAVYYQRATTLDPDNVDCWVQLSDCLHKLGDPNRAISALRRASGLAPRHPGLLINLASLHLSLKQPDVAISYLKQATQFDPNSGDAFNELGIAYMAQDNKQKAIEAYCEALRVMPNHAMAYNNLGTTLQTIGNLEDALACFEIATCNRPDLVIAWKNKGFVLRLLGRHSDALECFKQCVSLRPNDVSLRLSLGTALKEINKLDEAIECYKLALVQDPNSAEAACNLGACFKDKTNMEDAVSAYKLALKLQPDFPAALCQLIHCQQLMCDWEDDNSSFQKLINVIGQQLSRGDTPSVHPFHSLLYPLSLSMLKEIAVAYARKISSVNERQGLTPLVHPWTEIKFPIVIGYLSSDFGDQPLSHLIRSVPILHDRQRFKVVGFAACREDGSDYYSHFRSSFDSFVDVSAMSADEVVNIIKELGISVLINLNGYTKGAREDIFAARPAPIQISCLGFPGTSGASYMDYLVVDKVLVPDEFRYGYTENLIYLPTSCYVNDHCQVFVDKLYEPDQLGADNCQSNSSVYGPPHLPRQQVLSQITQFPFQDTSSIFSYSKRQFNLPTDKILLCNFNQLYKLDPNTFEIWCRILKRCPNTVLCLLRFPRYAEKMLLTRAHKLKVSPDRLIFLELIQKPFHIQRSSLCDLFLDTPLINAHHTGMDALWSGLPVLTLPGEKMASRVGASLNVSMGMTELIANSLSDYEEKAVYYVSNVEKLSELKKKVRHMRLRSRLFDTFLWTKSFEIGIEHVVNLYNNQEPFKDVEV
ncbi:hypothetical protein RCL1_007784 [Eukaryota sp. TZLM3-RCL]